MRFEKWQALGNDYLIVERDEVPFELTPPRVRRLCAGHFGVFADGVLLLSRPQNPPHVADLRIFNPDGSEAELSGNGAREAILYLRHRGWTDAERFSINTAAGVIRPTITGPFSARVEMGRAQLTSKDYPDGADDGLGSIAAGGSTWTFRHVSIGNPQCAIRVEDAERLAELDLPAIGPSIEADPRFPNRTNVSWYTELPNDGEARLRARIFERGVGETLSSGTGASGAAVAHVVSERARSQGSHADRAMGAGAGRASGVIVVLDGGELDVEVGEDLDVNLTGWARPVFTGRLSDEFTKELNETE